MARQETDREDLIREATALVRRVELTLPSEPEAIVAGFRRGGELSIYFGGDPTFQFDSAGRLRRAYSGGVLYRTQGTTLAQLDRQRTGSATELVRHDLAPAELQSFLAASAERLVALRVQLATGSAIVLRQVPEADSSIAADVLMKLEVALKDGIALAPAIPGKQ